MSQYYLYRAQRIPISVERAWDFFSHPSNLSEITPPELKFIILSKPEEIKTMYEGMIIEYKISPFLNIFFKWKTKIISIRGKESFTDVQVKGPYALWEHTHSFMDVIGGTEMKDELKYKLPYGPIGKLAHSAFVKNQIDSIFDFRSKKIEELFGKLEE